MPKIDFIENTKINRYGRIEAVRFGLFVNDIVASYICFVYRTTINGKIVHHIDGVNTFKEHRNKGYATLMMQKLIEWGEQNNIEMFSLQVYCSNIVAIKVYKKCGFEIADDHDRCIHFMTLKVKQLQEV